MNHIPAPITPRLRCFNNRCANKQLPFLKQRTRRFKLCLGLACQKSQNDIGVNRDHRICPHVSRALALTALQRIRLPFSCGASMPATSSTPRRRASTFNTASPLRTSQCTGSLAEICRAASTAGGTVRTVFDWGLRIVLYPVVKDGPIIAACAYSTGTTHNFLVQDEANRCRSCVHFETINPWANHYATPLQNQATCLPPMPQAPVA